jgi:hypothetical protein
MDMYDTSVLLKSREIKQSSDGTGNWVGKISISGEMNGCLSPSDRWHLWCRRCFALEISHLQAPKNPGHQCLS